MWVCVGVWVCYAYPHICVCLPLEPKAKLCSWLAAVLCETLAEWAQKAQQQPQQQQQWEQQQQRIVAATTATIRTTIDWNRCQIKAYGLTHNGAAGDNEKLHVLFDHGQSKSKSKMPAKRTKNSTEFNQNPNRSISYWTATHLNSHEKPAHSTDWQKWARRQRPKFPHSPRPCDRFVVSVNKKFDEYIIENE